MNMNMNEMQNAFYVKGKSIDDNNHINSNNNNDYNINYLTRNQKINRVFVMIFINIRELFHVKFKFRGVAKSPTNKDGEVCNSN